MSNKRRIIVVLFGVGILAALALVAIPALASLRNVNVTILVPGGAPGAVAQKTVQADVPPCAVLTPVDGQSGNHQGVLGIGGTPVQDANGNQIVGIIGVADCSDADGPAAPAPGKGQPDAGPVPDELGGSEPGSSGGGAQKQTGSKHSADHSVGESNRPAGRRGAPDGANPSLSLSTPGAAPVGVPNFFIEKFRIPPFLLPIYQAAGIQYGIRWEVLAAINEIETDYGRNLSVSSAGALGWMQFMPGTWRSYGTDANGDGRKDPYNPVDAVFAAARYLKAAGGDKPGGLRRAIFAYNHAGWYVDSVMMRARLVAGLPADLVGSLTGLTQGRFPVHAKARYAERLRLQKRHLKGGQNAARVVESKAGRRHIDIFAAKGSPVIAAQDGKVIKIGTDHARGDFLVLEDVSGNRYTYSHLGTVASRYIYPKAPSGQKGSDQSIEKASARKGDPVPTEPASAGRHPGRKSAREGASGGSQADAGADQPAKERLFANPDRPRTRDRAAAYGQSEGAGRGLPGWTTFRAYYGAALALRRSEIVVRPLEEGSKVMAGTTLGTVGNSGPDQTLAPHLRFQIRPAGRGSPQIDPKPILDGWKLLESTAIYRAHDKNPFVGKGARASVGQVFLMALPQLERDVLADPRIQIYGCGRDDIRSGRINRRVLVTLAYLAASGLRPTVTSLRCGHSYLTASGNVSEHSSGNAVDIAEVNGISIYGHQGRGTITEITIRRLLQLQGQYQPHQIISLMDMGPPTMVLADHDDHIHVGFAPTGDAKALGRAYRALLGPRQWDRLVKHLGDIRNPVVSTSPSKYATPTTKHRRGSKAHAGD